MKQGEEIRVRGIVQGVGFRPFVYRLARRLGLSGDVRNAGDHVVIRAAGTPAALDAFAQALREEAPPLARVADVARAPAAVPDEDGFVIAESGAGTISAGIVPDVATCPACQTEIFDAKGRRQRYAFTNCTDCGPRFSIALGLPYDRASTTMAGFKMCPRCQGEYDDPADRRFHAQPIACPACGPILWVEHVAHVAAATQRRGSPAKDPVGEATQLLLEGRTVAVKGIGGYHLACDATNEEAVALLRARKERPKKPLAVMADLAMAEALCLIDEEARAALAHPSAPIVLLPLRPDAGIAPSVAPGQAHLGVMLPYTPLHHLLMEEVRRPLVMTSGNRSNEPQAFRDADARESLSDIAEAFLIHDRPIARRLDDSVVRLAAGQRRVLRRGRGLAPMPLSLPEDFAEAPAVLALGGELKSAFCLTQGRNALLSHHLGDLDEPSTAEEFDAALDDYRAIFQHAPAIVAVDRHPDYRASRRGADLARETGLPLVEVQHHHAHIASAMAEAGWRRDQGAVIGIALDGLGFGEDETVWGAEILLCDYREMRRLARLSPIPLIGGDAASREPFRVLLAHLERAFGREALEDDARLAALFAGRPLPTLFAMMDQGINTTPASSAGRLFDAMAHLLGLAPGRISFEGEAAMALEALAVAHGEEAPYSFALRQGPEGLGEIDPEPMWRAALADLDQGRPPAAMAAAFHAGVAEAFAAPAAQLAEALGIGTIALSGGVFQNGVLLEDMIRRITARGLQVIAPAEVPANDGGLAFGQAAIAAARAYSPYE